MPNHVQHRSSALLWHRPERPKWNVSAQRQPTATPADIANDSHVFLAHAVADARSTTSERVDNP